ncbi:hypothetical protein F5880DRAFT_1461105, partial [Lentinula raphanica]
DYALAPEGAIVINLTSPTLSAAPVQDLDLLPTPPIAVIEEDVRISRCWKFAGGQGHVAIKLAKDIQLSNITIHYPDHRELPSWRQMEVPKLFRVWALLTSDVVVPPSLSSQFLINWEAFASFTKRPVKPSALFDASMFVHAATISYDVQQGMRQTFPLQTPIRLSTSVVVIEILDNQGGSSTCLHRFAIHGEE